MNVATKMPTGLAAARDYVVQYRADVHDALTAATKGGPIDYTLLSDDAQATGHELSAFTGFGPDEPWIGRAQQAVRDVMIAAGSVQRAHQSMLWIDNGDAFRFQMQDLRSAQRTLDHALKQLR